MGQGTAELLIVTAERLYGEQGIDAVSLRQIAEVAGQRNPAVVQYHFGTKEGLLRAIVEYRVKPANIRRHAMLDALERSGQVLDLRRLLEAAIVPLLDEQPADSRYLQFVARLPRSRAALAQVFGDIDDEYGGSATRIGLCLDQALKELPAPIRAHRLAVAFDTLLHALANYRQQAEDGVPDLLPWDLLVDDLILGVESFLRAAPSVACGRAADVDPDRHEQEPDMTDHDASTDPPAVTLTRTIPIPKSVSAHAQAVLASSGVVARGDTPNPDRDDIEGWHEHIAQIETALCAAFEARTKDAHVTVEEMSLAGLPVYDITPEGVDEGSDQPLYLDIHGGAFAFGGGASCRAMATNAAERARLRTWSIDYRMPPDHPYPASLDDCLAVYRAAIELRSPDRIIVGGASAGGNLAAALMFRIRDEGLPLPAALVLLSPATDLTQSGDTFHTNLGLDTALRGSTEDLIWLYGRDHDLSDPYLSPLFGDFSPPFPPTFLQSGTRDLLLSSTVRMHRAMRAAGVDADLHVWEAMPHGGFWGAPEDTEMAEELRRFIAAHLPTTSA